MAQAFSPLSRVGRGAGGEGGLGGRLDSCLSALAHSARLSATNEIGPSTSRRLLSGCGRTAPGDGLLNSPSDSGGCKWVGGQSRNFSVVCGRGFLRRALSGLNAVLREINTRDSTLSRGSPSRTRLNLLMLNDFRRICRCRANTVGVLASALQPGMSTTLRPRRVTRPPTDPKDGIPRTQR